MTHDLRTVLLASAGPPAVTFHGLRHSAASLLIAAGCDARTVQELLGHSDVRLTLAVYQHVFKGLARRRPNG